jgi:hypothetical protein
LQSARTRIADDSELNLSASALSLSASELNGSDRELNRFDRDLNFSAALEWIR